MDSVTRSSLNKGVLHLPNTSLPWSDIPERKVYLAGHRLGWPGTGSHLIFYHLNELTGGERITLRTIDGTGYNYKVLESFAVWPDESMMSISARRAGFGGPLPGADARSPTSDQPQANLS
jgi:sortase A